MKLTKAKVSNISQKALAALKVLEDELGGEFVMGSGSYTENSFTIKVEFSLGSIENRREAEWAILAPQYGLKATDFGRVLKGIKGETIKLIGIERKRRKYPILTETDGKEVLYTLDYIEHLLAQ